MAAALALAACATVPDAERLLVPLPDGGAMALVQACGQARPAPPPARVTTARAPVALDPRRLRVVSWNIHKGEDEGWQADLSRYAADHDLVLLQEAVLSPPMRGVLEQAGHEWRMAGAFAFNGEERGVLAAARVPPVDGCMLREFEPLFRLPKSALVTRYPLQGSNQTVAVANLHGINFTLLMGSFSSQLDAVAAELKGHDGPIIFAGDFNTWSEVRSTYLREVAARLGLQPVEPKPDGRRRALGYHLDHLFVRGFSVLEATSPTVKSSDHNPILVTLTATP